MRNREAEEHVQVQLAGIANRARIDKKHRFGGLYSLLNEGFLRWSYHQLNRKAAAGVDGVTWEEYGRELDRNLRDLTGRLKAKTYKARLVRRHYIPKGNGKRRPLGIPVLEDKLVQYAAKAILEAIYEADFYKYSFGYRPGRGAKDAVGKMAQALQFGPYGWVVDADIKGFFDTMDHDWMIRMLEERIHDRAFIGLIRKWLKAGVLDELQTVTHPATGTPQGGVISPVLANIYLHYVLDMWYLKRVRKETRGENVMVRYADDFVSAFRFRAEAEEYLGKLKERLGKFGLSLAEGKTRLVRHTRFEIHRNESFNFLGFEVRWGLDRKREPHIKCTTMIERMRRGLQSLADWCRKGRSMGLGEMLKTFGQKLSGHWNYYGVHFNGKRVKMFYRQACRTLHKWLSRRSQRRTITWDGFQRMLERHKVPEPRLVGFGQKRSLAV